MATLDVIDLSGSKVGQVDVADDVFAADVKEHLLWEAVRSLRAAKRAGTAKVKTRAEITGSRAKTQRQKGTGRARHGAPRVNVFRGGGQVHGPVPRKYNVGINKKAMAGALRSALTLRARDGDLVVIKELTQPEIKTKALAKALDTIATPRALLVDSGENAWLRLSSRNLPRSCFLDVRGLNVYDVLRFPKLVISEASLRQVEARLTGGGAAEQSGGES